MEEPVEPEQPGESAEDPVDPEDPSESLEEPEQPGELNKPKVEKKEEGDNQEGNKLPKTGTKNNFLFLIGAIFLLFGAFAWRIFPKHN